MKYFVVELSVLGNQTYVDFAREKGILLDRWRAAYKADILSCMCEFLLLEEFKNSVPQNVNWKFSPCSKLPLLLMNLC